MKFHNKALPYPLIDSGDLSRDDYQKANFSVHLDDIAPEGSNFKLHARFECDVDELVELIKTKKAVYALSIESPKTNTKEIYQCGDSDLHLDLKVEDYYGRVEFSPMIVAVESIPSYTSKWFHEEFSDQVFDLEPGDVLGVAESITRTFEFNKTSFESLVSVKVSDDLDPNVYKIDLEGNLITIFMGRELIKNWQSLRLNPNYRPFLAMSIYKDIFLQAMDEYIRNEDSRELKWAYGLNAKLDELGLKLNLDPDVDISDLNVYAQLIMEEEASKKLSKLIEGGE